jgi:hypothetical protein
MDDNRVAGLQRQVLLLQRAFEIFHGDFVIVAEHLDALEGGHVDQDAARE